MSTTNLIIVTIAALIVIAIISFVILSVIIIKHQQKMFKEFGVTDFNKATSIARKGNHHD